MAFTPIMKELEIDGVLYKAQYNGPSAFMAIQEEAGQSNAKWTDYILKNVIVEPEIGNIDEYFGTDLDHMDKVITFGMKVCKADVEYFPKKFGEKAKATNKK